MALLLLRGVLQGLTDCTAAIEEAMTSLRKGAGTGLKVLEEALKRSFTDGAIGGLEGLKMFERLPLSCSHWLSNFLANLPPKIPN